MKGCAAPGKLKEKFIIFYESCFIIKNKNHDVGGQLEDFMEKIEAKYKDKGRGIVCLWGKSW